MKLFTEKLKNTSPKTCFYVALLFLGCGVFAQPTIGTTSFSFATDVGLASGDGSTTVTATDVGSTGWNMTATMTSGNSSAHILRGGNNEGISGTAAVLYFNVAAGVQSMRFSSDDGSEFDLNSFAINSTQGATNYTVTGHRDGSDVTGASFSGSLTQSTLGGAFTTIDASGDDDFNNIDGFTITFTSPQLRFIFDDINIGTAIPAGPVNNAPVFTSSTTASFVENASGTVIDVAANDGDGGGEDANISYSISGTDASLFSINATNGQITFDAAPDFENPMDNGSNNVYDVTVTANDGEASNNTTDQNIAITVTGVNENASVATNTGISVNEGGTEVINNTELNEGDPDDSGSGITYTVTTLPSNGSVQLSSSNLLQNGTFTQDDVDNNRVQYVHNGGETTSDSFVFSMADGLENGASAVTGQTFSITVNAQNDGVSVATNTGISVNEG
ncbi:MAG: cadherin-like domain-containing protein, partial [Bacteroidota bacterium]